MQINGNGISRGFGPSRIIKLKKPITPDGMSDRLHLKKYIYSVSSNALKSLPQKMPLKIVLRPSTQEFPIPEMVIGSNGIQHFEIAKECGINPQASYGGWLAINGKTIHLSDKTDTLWRSYSALEKYLRDLCGDEFQIIRDDDLRDKIFEWKDGPKNPGL
jgi:hypothetical protein